MLSSFIPVLFYSQFYLDNIYFQPTFADLLIEMYNWLCSMPESPQNQENMKKDIHPKSYRLVVFKDMSNGHTFLSRSTANTKETIKWEDGKEYPLVKLEISNTSHPFFTGKNVLVDTAGRIDKFKKKYAKKAE